MCQSQHFDVDQSQNMNIINGKFPNLSNLYLQNMGKDNLAMIELSVQDNYTNTNTHLLMFSDIDQSMCPRYGYTMNETK